MLDDYQVLAILKASSRKGKNGVRNYAIILLFLDCGLRLSELTNLRLAGLSLHHRSLRVQGKGAKERMVYLGERTSKVLRKWLAYRGQNLGFSDHIFLDRKGDPGPTRWGRPQPLMMIDSHCNKGRKN